MPQNKLLPNEGHWLWSVLALMTVLYEQMYGQPTYSNDQPVPRMNPQWAIVE